MRKIYLTGLLLLFVGACNSSSPIPDGGVNKVTELNSAAPLPDAGKLVKRLVTQDGCKDFVAEMRITSDSADGKLQPVEVRLQRKYSATGAFTFLTVLSPKEDSDKAILAIEDSEKPTEAMSYLAGLKKLAKLNSSRPLGFRGAKITVQELLGMELGHYSHDAGERITLDGQSFIKIVFQAKPDLNLVFPRIVGYFREKEESPARFELFGEDGEIAKKMTIEEVKFFQNYQTITQVAIEDVSQKLKLKMQTRKIEYDRGLQDKIFTEDYLKSFITSASNK
ncbi:MAG: outer membrane lipoprotein-sorting protein [Blastocatellia bacterium]